MSAIHPTAIIDRRAEVADGAEVGAYCIIEGRVQIGSRTRILPHCVLRGHSVIGSNCLIGPAAYIGMDPQHQKFDRASETSLSIGDDVIIRETASVHRSLKPGIENATRIGSQCFLMGQAHVGHDCRVDDEVILAQGAMLGGHVHVGARAFIGGGGGVHQFCRIGRVAIVKGNEGVTRDVPPFGAVMHDALKGYNAVGCRRAGLSRESIRAIRAAYQCLHTHRTMTAAVEAIKSLKSDVPEVHEILDFIATTKRGIQPSVHFLDRAIESDSD